MPPSKGQQNAKVRPALTVREVAEYLTVDEKTVYRLVQRRELPAFKVAGSWRFRPEEIDEWIAASREAAVPRVRGAARLRALIVEDDEVDRMAIRRALQQADLLSAVESVEVSTLAEAKQALASARWDCVVLDRRLPDGDGISLIDEPPQTLGDAAVVVLTGIEDEGAARALLRSGAQDYLVKGRLDGPTLLRSIRYAIERKRFDEQLRLSEANFRGLIEHSPDAICVMRDGLVLYANPAFCVLLSAGASGKELQGANVQDFLHPDDESKLLRPADEGAAPRDERETHVEPGPETLFEIRLRTGGGDWLTAEAWTRRVRFDGQEALGLVCRDITRRKLLEEQVIFSSRMAAVGTLAAGVAHELNSPLSYVMGNLDFVSAEMNALLHGLEALLPSLPPSLGVETLRSSALGALEAITEAKQGADRVKYIIRDLKTFARPTDSAEAAVRLVHAVDWSLGIVAHEIRQKARLVKDYRGDPTVFGNEAKIGQIVINLLINASHAVPDGAASAHEICVTIDDADEGFALLAVRDSGCGIPPENLGRIFEPFFTTKPIGKGTGLGLSVCHGIVTALGGSIEVTSEVGRGTTFRVRLPRAEGEKVAAQRKMVEELRSPRAEPRGRVLIIDDDRLVVTALARTLSRQHEILSASDGRQALELLARDDAFHVIFCDVMMPHFDGVDFYLTLAAQRPELAERIVFITGGAFSGRAQAFLERVPNLRLEKPLDMANLRAVIHERLKSTRETA